MSALASAKADRDDYERRWLAECRAHGETRRSLEARIAELESQLDDDACSCEPQNAYLCLRCERIAEDQDIGF